MLLRTVFIFLFFIASAQIPSASEASTVYISGKSISSIGTVAKKDILSGYFDPKHTLKINKSTSYDYIRSSNNSSDRGFDHDFYRVNIVDYLLENRAGAYNYKNDTYTDNNTYTFIGQFTGFFETNNFTARIIDEIAGHQTTNTLNYYLANDKSTTANTPKKNLIFKGSDSSGAISEINFQSPQKIGFNLGVPATGNEFFTEAFRNTNKEIHSAVFQVGKTNTYIIGFEDLSLGASDRDYQDMIVSVTMAPIPNPEPSTLLLMGIGAAGAAFMNRRKRGKVK